jgi:hypothetical protein
MPAAALHCSRVTWARWIGIGPGRRSKRQSRPGRRVCGHRRHRHHPSTTDQDRCLVIPLAQKGRIRTAQATGSGPGGQTPETAPADGSGGGRLESPNTIACTRANTEAKATARASSRIGVLQGIWRMALVRIRNSLANTPNGGMPRMASDRASAPSPAWGWPAASRGCRP